MLSISSKLGLNKVNWRLNTRLVTYQAPRTRRTVDEQLTRLDSEVRRLGRVSTKDVTDLFNQIKGKKSATSTQALLLIRCCGDLLSEETPDNRTKLVQNAMKVFQSAGVNLDISHYNALLKVYLENENKFNPLEILKEIESNGVVSNRVTYQRLIHHYCQNGDIEGATKLLEYMKAKEIPLNEAVFNSLILGYGKAGDIDSARNTLSIMKNAGAEPTSESYTALLQVVAEAAVKDPSKTALIDEVLNEAQQNETMLTDFHLLQVVKHIAVLDGPSDALVDKILDLCRKGKGYNLDCVNATLVLVNKGKVDAAYKLYQTLYNSKETADYSVSGMFFISQLVRTSVDPEKVFEICREMSATGKNKYAFSKAAEVALEFADFATAKKYVRKFVQETQEENGVRAEYFWPLIAKCSSSEEVLEIIANDMQTLSFSASSNALAETFSSYVWPKIQEEDREKVIKKCEELGFSKSILVSSLVEYLLTKNDDSAVFALLRNYEDGNFRVQPRNLIQELANFYVQTGKADSSAKMLKIFLRYSKKDDDHVGRFLNIIGNNPSSPSVKDISSLAKKLVDLKLSMSEEAAERFKRKVSLNDSILKQLVEGDSSSRRSYYEDDDLSKPRERMDLEEQENLYTELSSKNKGLRGIIRSLLIEYSRVRPQRQADSNDESDEAKTMRSSSQVINRVNELISHPEAQPLSDATRACLMHIYTTHANDVDKALQYRKEMSPDFDLDYFKVLGLVMKMAENKRIDEALEYLKDETRQRRERVAKGITRERNEMSEAAERNIFQALNAVAEATKDGKRVNEFFDAIYEYLDFAKPSNVTCGPRVKVHLMNENLEAALAEYNECANNYKTSPWKQELMKMFIEKEDSANLQLITDQSISIYGESNALFDLALAFISTDRLKQAKKIFATPGLRIVPKRVNSLMTRFINAKNVKECENFVKVTAGFDVDRENCYYDLIRCCAAAESPENALEAWTAMQEEGVVPSDRILRYLGKFLEKNNITPPFIVPEGAAPEQPNGNRESRAIKTKTLSAFLDAVRQGNTDLALQCRKELETNGQTLALGQECILVEKLLAKNELKSAADIVKNMMITGQYPFPRVLRETTQKLSKAGSIDALQELDQYFPAEFKNQTWYTNQLTEAYLKSNLVDKFVDEILPTLKPFPLGGLMNILSNRPEMESRLVQVADKLAAEDSYTMPQNMMWQYFMKKKRYSEADALFDRTPAFQNSLYVYNVCDHIRSQYDTETARHLIKTLNRSNVAPRSIGLAYSAFIDALVEENKADEAEKLVIEEILTAEARTSSSNGEKIPAVTLSDLNRMALVRLSHKITESLGRPPKFDVPEKIANFENDDKRSAEASN
ncbi:Leucine-rich PPR motif-containing protein, mitochondrial [Halotydeus destructor]|nr:Leucine-rich PPR motif-containing protein, mitochondrial [Halotydeus destructor]